MTNEQIITNIAISLYGEDAVREMLENGDEIPLHTVQGWASRGPYKVKKGEHGHECRLWKKKKNRDHEQKDAEDNPPVSTNHNFYLCKSFLFRADQIEQKTE